MTSPAAGASKAVLSESARRQDLAIGLWDSRCAGRWDCWTCGVAAPRFRDSSRIATSSRRTCHANENTRIHAGVRLIRSVVLHLHIRCVGAAHALPSAPSAQVELTSRRTLVAFIPLGPSSN